MRRESRIFIFSLLFLLVFGFGQAAAQSEDEPANKPANNDNSVKAPDKDKDKDKKPLDDPAILEAVKGTTAEIHEIEVKDLELKLKPLPKEDLQGEVDAWLVLVKAVALAQSDMEINAKKLEGKEKEDALKEAGKLGAQRVALVDRLNAALKALEAKGGDVESYRQYVSVISDMNINITDMSGTWIKITEWLKSEEGGIRWGFNILSFILCILAFKILASILAGVTKKAVSKLKYTTEILREFFVNTVRRVTFLIGLVMALSCLEIEIGPILAAMGIAGFVIAFALQETLANFASGIMLLLYRPFDIGDAVTVSGVTGKVDGMSLVSTKIKTFDNQSVVVPNSKIWGDVITNITANNTRRVDMVFGIGYSDDIAKAQSVMEEILKGHPLVLENPEFVIQVSELADSSVNFVVRPWVKTADYWTVYWDVTRSVKERFDAESISIPFPQQDVHMHQVAEA